MKPSRTGFTTGTCAAAAAKAATLRLCGKPIPKQVDIWIAEGTRVRLPVLRVRNKAASCEAAVRKDAGSDPDITHGASIVASVAWTRKRGIVFRAGAGVGTVTRPGLSVPPGEPSINPVPRKMIETAVREVTSRSVEVTISIPGGRRLAQRTFNPRLGVMGGLSIIGTTGRVRPFSTSALRDAVRCAVNVAEASGVRNPVLVPGHIGERAARRHFRLRPEQVIEAGNDWGFLIDEAGRRRFTAMLIVGHPGKLAKLAAGDWDTHSSRSASAVDYVRKLISGEPVNATTVEELMEAQSSRERSLFGNILAAQIANAIRERLRKKVTIAVVLINLKGELRGSNGNLTPWR
jgi:cobalt-precorrin-5B (C1)-methyltransferase